jgi:hypothetical protein
MMSGKDQIRLAGVCGARLPTPPSDRHLSGEHSVVCLVSVSSEQRRGAMRSLCLLVDDRCVAIVAKELSRVDRAFSTPFTAATFLKAR